MSGKIVLQNNPTSVFNHSNNFSTKLLILRIFSRANHNGK